MRTNKIFALLMFSTAMLASCTGNKTDKSVFWGTTKFYSDFPFKKYEPVKMEKTLEFDFNNDAQRLGFNNVEFEVVEKQVDEKNGKVDTVPAKGIELYKNNTLCPNNILTITPKDKEIKLDIVFTKDAAEGTHTLFLRCKNMGGLDRIDNTELASGISIEKQVIYNPLEFLLFWVLMVIMGINILLIIIFHYANPKFKIRELRVVYYSSNGEIIPPAPRRIRLQGCYQVICTNKKQRQSFFDKLFKGKMLFEVSDFWENEIVLNPKSASKNTVRIVKNPYDPLIKSINKGYPIEFVNSNNEKVIFNF